MPSNVLPPTWTTVTATEIVPAPVDIGKTFANPLFARKTTTVRNSIGQFVAASGDAGDAETQALAICQARIQPYNSATWPFP
jgi:hypothetical protein